MLSVNDDFLDFNSKACRDYFYSLSESKGGLESVSLYALRTRIVQFPVMKKPTRRCALAGLAGWVIPAKFVSASKEIYWILLKQCIYIFVVTSSTNDELYEI